jgi:hypothetical protein
VATKGWIGFSEDDDKLDGKAAVFCQRVEDNAFHLKHCLRMDRLFLKMPVRLGPMPIETPKAQMPGGYNCPRTGLSVTTRAAWQCAFLFVHKKRVAVTFPPLSWIRLRF